jgi:DNA-binding protein H-NS
MAALRELLDQQTALTKRIAELRSSERLGAIAEVQALMARHGLTVEDLSGGVPTTRRSASSRTGKKVAAKYRHPVSGVTWSGRGLKPKWLMEEIRSGKTLQDFAV